MTAELRLSVCGRSLRFAGQPKRLSLREHRLYVRMVASTFKVRSLSQLDQSLDPAPAAKEFSS
jgi:hypothetical protein